MRRFHTLGNGACYGILCAMLLCCSARQIRAQDLILHSGALYSPDSGSTDEILATFAGFSAVPYLCRFDPMTNGVPSPRARNTYMDQQAGALAGTPNAWRSFFAWQDAAVVQGGNPIDARDIANTL